MSTEILKTTQFKRHNATKRAIVTTAIWTLGSGYVEMELFVSIVSVNDIHHTRLYSGASPKRLRGLRTPLRYERACYATSCVNAKKVASWNPQMTTLCLN